VSRSTNLRDMSSEAEMMYLLSAVIATEVTRAK